MFSTPSTYKSRIVLPPDFASAMPGAISPETTATAASSCIACLPNMAHWFTKYNINLGRELVNACCNAGWAAAARNNDATLHSIVDPNTKLPFTSIKLIDAQTVIGGACAIGASLLSAAFNKLTTSTVTKEDIVRIVAYTTAAIVALPVWDKATIGGAIFFAEHIGGNPTDANNQYRAAVASGMADGPTQCVINYAIWAIAKQIDKCIEDQKPEEYRSYLQTPFDQPLTDGEELQKNVYRQWENCSQGGSRVIASIIPGSVPGAAWQLIYNLMQQIGASATPTGIAVAAGVAICSMTTSALEQYVIPSFTSFINYMKNKCDKTCCGEAGVPSIEIGSISTTDDEETAHHEGGDETLISQTTPDESMNYHTAVGIP